MNAVDSKFPTILVVAEFWANATTGGAALARQMLKGYPADKIVWWSYLTGPGRSLGQQMSEEFSYTMPGRLYPNRRGKATKGWLLEKVWMPRAARHLAGVVARVAPQQTWVILHGWAIPIVERIGLISTKRSHVSVWDYQDHLLCRPRFGSDERAARAARTVEALYRTAASADAVSRPMWEDLARQTGRGDAIIVHSGVEPAQLEAMAAPEAAGEASEIRIAYAGAIIATKTFELCIRALETIRTRLGKPLRLEFFGGFDFAVEPWFNPDWMRLNGTPDDTQLNQALRGCQWGFAPMDLHDNNARYNRFSLPNKFGSYLAEGLPVLVVGHRESSAARVVRDYGVGYWSDLNDVAALGEALRGTLIEGGSRRRYREAILRCVREEFDAEAIRRRLWERWGVR